VTATLIDGRALAARVREQVAAEVTGLAPPGLATVLVGDDPYLSSVVVPVQGPRVLTAKYRKYYELSSNLAIIETRLSVIRVRTGGANYFGTCPRASPMQPPCG
jgi:5,10-methylene-tetrahydrofolate dehydrogenase/methenyl tetrahydrofolate cyclohydrolase